MQIGVIGLGKMGLNLALNLVDHGHKVIGYDSHAAIEESGFKKTSSISELVEKLETPRTVWLMVPAGEITESVITELTPLLEKGDSIIDGGNSNYKDTVRRAEQLKEQGLYFFDCGTSGGTEGARKGICSMIGGDAEKFKEIEPLFKDISVEDGYLYTGEPGSGHFLKMVHNGIEYGMMQSIAEGFEILNKSNFDFDYEKVAGVWNNGSIIRSYLMGLTQNAFSKDEKLDGIRGVMNSSGEGKWTVETALDLNVPAPVITLSLMMRYRSLEDDTFTGKVVAALRNEFGGHAVEKK
ncbi:MULTISPECIES: phosphogluconate dehydrogenase (NAD(+)-dependent, decarboxylating) [unclassified Planococcus (in: firmicutes)]|uniref:phosphogluconate dehydrogenase (NAD(+)-dependent, decarboxylating) n=1 Tax=unclassified Planococcus (in: firmicutes) TaxID=2662419 RepID=UPI001F32D4D3|nr:MULTISPECIES: decarboxylating 6-phosphogluconate dehydrogenase [unclassified Planococcus (in: firmicutes)]UJF26845.1 decarboxylating 6-phosphogluconate dehydrogenase [Planococcus sp. 107-1]GKW46061.1 6-phosphogluconate dehydrogenase (decarboxylating) [Planococcus sp. NCCP-2050]